MLSGSAPPRSQAKPGSEHLEAPETPPENREAGEPESGRAPCTWAERRWQARVEAPSRAAQVLRSARGVSRPRMRKRNMAEGSGRGQRRTQMPPQLSPKHGRGRRRNAGSWQHLCCRKQHSVGESCLPTASSCLSPLTGVASHSGYSHRICWPSQA